jgi:hypothetical protein
MERLGTLMRHFLRPGMAKPVPLLTRGVLMPSLASGLITCSGRALTRSAGRL